MVGVRTGDVELLPYSDPIIVVVGGEVGDGSRGHGQEDGDQQQQEAKDDVEQRREPEDVQVVPPECEERDDCYAEQHDD
eukprot:SAG22_NODE_10596_length_526_cov_0.796253_1_plen_78_part_10